MKAILIIALIIPFYGFGQNTPIFSNYVNPTVLKTVETQSQIGIEYGTFGVDISCLVIKQNIRTTLQWMVDEGMVPFVAQNYTEGGSWESRINLANKIMYDIIMDRNPILNNPSLSYFREEQFAKDWELFSMVNKLPREKSNILSSSDKTIPINIISNHPLLLVNGKRDPRIISTSKSIKIK
jgi:hypothetical protein